MRQWVLVMLVCACGRLNFDPHANGGDALPPFAIAQARYIKASNTDAGDNFSSVAVSGDGNTIAVGADGEASNATGIGSNEADNSLAGAGAVYVFVRSGGVWVQQAYLKASNTGAGDGFGRVVALSTDGNTLAVSAPFERSNATGIDGNEADNTFSSAGAVYIFTRSGPSWSQQAYLKASNTGSTDRFGEAIAISGDGNVLVVGAFQEQSNATGVDGNELDNSLANAGAAYVFRRTTIWQQEAYLKASNTDANDNFGRDVAISADGSTICVGARNESSNATGIGGDQANDSLANAGAAYVFVHSTGWTRQAYVKAAHPDTDDIFGRDVDLSSDGGTLAVGGYQEDSGSVGVGGSETDNSVTNSGAIWLFDRAGTTWSQTSYAKATNPGADDELGYVSLSANGLWLVGGADLEDSASTGIDGDGTNNTAIDSGAVYLYSRVTGTWLPSAYIKASNTNAGDGFGLTAISADGRTLVIGAYGEASNATGIDSNQADNSKAGAGAVYVFDITP